VAGSNVTITPNDAADTITISSTGGGSFEEDPVDPGFFIPGEGASNDPEFIRDTIASALVAGSNVTITPNDAGDTITIAAATDPEVVRDTMATALVAGANVTITPNDAGDTITIASTGGGGGSVSNAPTYIVATSDSTQADKDAATADGFLAGSTNAHVQIQAAIDAAMQNTSGGGTVKLCPGTYNTTATVSLGHPTDSTGTYRVNLHFERGAKMRWIGVTGTTPILKIESSDCTVTNPWIQGSGVKGNGTGISFGGDTTNYGGRWTKTVYRSSVIDPFVTNCRNGITFAVDKTGTSSSGDNNVIRGFVTNCVEGINSAGFVNRLYGTTLAVNDYNIHGTNDRNSHKLEVFGGTYNSWAQASIWLEKDDGSQFDGLWMEHTGSQTSVPAQAILLGGTTNADYTAHNTRFSGNTQIAIYDEQDVVRVIRGNNVVFENLVMSTDTGAGGSVTPTRAIFRQDSNHAGTVVCERLCWMTGIVPTGWSYPTKAISKDAAATGKVIIKAVPGVVGAAKNTVFGDTTPVPVDATYYIDKSGSPNSATYWAKDRTGHIAAFAADTSTTSGLKAVLQGLMANDVHFRFGPGRYHYKDAPLGNESWAGVEDHPSFTTTKGVTFSGAGMYSTIISNRSNFPTGTDTEPFSFTNCQYTTIRDLAVEACGFYKSTTDAIDFDQGAHLRVERVRVTRSRARGIVVDGGDPGKWGGHNVIRDCVVQGRPDRPNLSLISGGSLTASTAYRYVVSWTDQDLAGANVAGETKPSDEAVVTTDSTNRSVTLDLPIGPYTVTERKVYRAVVGSNAWVRVATVANNTATTYTDTGGAGTSVTMPVSEGSTVYDSGIEMLGTGTSDILNNTVDGTGDMISGLNRHGINISRKSSVPTAANFNKVLGNTVRQVGSIGVRILGGSDNMVKDNDISNCGSVATRGQAIRVEGATGVSTLRNEIKDNRCYDDQDANSWSGGQTINNQITISATGSPTDTIVSRNVLTPGNSSNTILDSGVNSFVYDNYGFGAEFSLLEIGTDQTANFTITQSMSSQVIRVNSSSTVTVTLPVLKAGTNFSLIRWGTGAVNIAVTGTTVFRPSGASASPRAQYSEVQFKYLTTTDILETGDMG
jgi:hypothetical protein